MNEARPTADAVQHDELTCRELVHLVTAYLDGALDSAERVRFEAHLAGCSGCRRHLEQMRITIDLTGRLAEDHLDGAARERWLAAFRTWKRG